MPETTDQLEEYRRKLLERYETLRGFYDSPGQQQFQQGLEARASGSDVPYTQNVINSQLSQNADAGAAGHASNQNAIQRAFANSGMSGSGLQASATLNSRRRTQAATRTGRNQIRSRADLENFQARERANQQLQSYVAQKYQALASATADESQYLSRLHATGDAENVAQATGTDLTQQPQQAAPAPVQQAPQRPQNSPFYGQNPYLGNIDSGLAQYTRNLGSGATDFGGQRYAADQARREQMRDDWYRRQNIFLSQWGG